MHRSGTSCLTGCLEEAGLTLGDVNREAPHNRKGNNENGRIMRLHDDVLAENSGSWDVPPREVLWSSTHRSRRDEILDEYRQLPVFGIKDPRTLLTLEGWLEVLPEMRVVGTFRHPLAVARSLGARNGLSLAAALELWVSYNRHLIDYREHFGADLISFDLPPEQYLGKVSEAARRLGLEPPPGGFSFFESRLRQQAVPAGESLPRVAQEMYAQLLEMSL